MRLFLEAFKEVGTIAGACQSVIVWGRPLSRDNPARWARRFPAFAEAWAKAKEEVNDKVEREIYRRAVEGWEEPVYQGGALVGQIRKFDSSLLMFLAKANMPEKYREKFDGASVGPNFNFIGAGNDVIRAIASLSPEELERLAARGRPIEGEVRMLEEAPV